MDPILAQVLGAAAYGLVTFGIGYVVGKLGITKIETDIAQIKADITNFRFQTPFTVTPTVIDVTPPTGTVLPNPIGETTTTSTVVAHL